MSIWRNDMAYLYLWQSNSLVYSAPATPHTISTSSVLENAVSPIWCAQFGRRRKNGNEMGFMFRVRFLKREAREGWANGIHCCQIIYCKPHIVDELLLRLWTNINHNILTKFQHTSSIKMKNVCVCVFFPKWTAAAKCDTIFHTNVNLWNGG